MSKRVRNTYQARVTPSGTIILPKRWIKQNNINPGDILTFIDLKDGVVIFRPQVSRFEKIAGKLAREWQDAGESLESMLNTLHEVRAELDRKTL